MTRQEAVQLLCRIPIGTPLVLDTSEGQTAELDGVVGYFAGLGLRAGEDTIKLTGGNRVRGRAEALNTEVIDQVLLDDIRRVSVQLTDVRRGRLA